MSSGVTVGLTREGPGLMCRARDESVNMISEDRPPIQCHSVRLMQPIFSSFIPRNSKTSPEDSLQELMAVL